MTFKPLISRDAGYDEEPMQSTFVAVNGHGRIYETKQTDGILTIYKSNGNPCLQR